MSVRKLIPLACCRWVWHTRSLSKPIPLAESLLHMCQHQGRALCEFAVCGVHVTFSYDCHQVSATQSLMQQLVLRHQSLACMFTLAVCQPSYSQRACLLCYCAHIICGWQSRRTVGLESRTSLVSYLLSTWQTLHTSSCDLHIRA